MKPPSKAAAICQPREKPAGQRAPHRSACWLTGPGAEEIDLERARKALQRAQARLETAQQQA